MNNFFEILRGGINTTFQDVGRNNLHHIGISSSGAMDNRNFQLSNSILGNKSNNPVIESILNQTQANEANPNIIDEIDSGNELETDESNIEPKVNFFQRLFKVKKSKS